MKALKKHIPITLLALLISFSSIAQNNIENLKVSITFDGDPTGTTITHTPLKYNKDFALSFTMDDGLEGGYTHAYQFLYGGTVDGVDYDPLLYTDGCGNDINFSMSLALYSFSSYNNKDMHDPGGDGVTIYLSWPEIIEMYQNGCAVLNHGLTTATDGDIDYLVARNHSYIKSQTLDATDGGIHTTIFINPNGAAQFTQPAFNQGYSTAYRSITYGTDYLNVYNTSSIPDLGHLEIGRLDLESKTNVSDLADLMYNASQNNAETTPWSSTFTHSVEGKNGAYSFSTFKNYMNAIADTYGKNGLDNIWFTSEEEVMNYLLVKDAVSINQNILGNTLEIEFTGDAPDNLRNYAISLMVEADPNLTIQNISIEGDNSSAYNIDVNTALINLNWDGQDLPTALETATFWVDSTERVPAQNVANIAMDYLNILSESTEKENLLTRLCSVPGVTFPAGFCNNCSTYIGDDKTICKDDCTELSVAEASSYLWSTGETTQSITVCPDVTTTYSVEITDSEGCTADDEIVVNINEPPTVTTSNDTSICINDCIKIWAKGGSNYLWNTGEITDTIEICPLSTTTYSVVVTDDWGCESTANVQVEVIDLPQGQISNDTIICPYDCIQLWAKGGSSYLWSTGETTESIEVCPSEKTKYYVNIFNENGCSSLDSVIVDIHSLPDAEAGNNISLINGECATLIASGGTSYIWESGETSESIEICPDKSSWYCVEVGNEHNCYAMDSVYVSLKSAHKADSQQESIQSVIVLFETNPSFVNVDKTPLKYNKDFALSFHVKNGNKDIHELALPFLNGGSVDETTYPGLSFTDGCGNPVNFKMGTSVYAFGSDGETDIHDPDGNTADDFLTWAEITELYQNEWGIFNQGVLPDNSGDQAYSIARNQSFTKYKTFEIIDGGIPMSVIMNPSGDISFSTPAFKQNYRAAFANYSEGIQYYDISTIPNADSLKMGSNSLDGQQSIAAIADLMHNNYDPNTRLWASAYVSSLSDGATLGYSFSVFRFYMEYIESKYGSGGQDNIWFTHEEEVWDYLTTYAKTTVNKELLDDRLLITFSGTLPDNLNYSALSLLLESDANILSIEINGGNNNTYKIEADTSALINLNWENLKILPDSIQAENYVSLAEIERTTNHALVAMDYVNMLSRGSKKIELRDRLCDITEATYPDGFCNCEFSLGNDTIVCLGDCIDLTAPEGISYFWNTGETTQTIEVCPEDTAKYWVTVYNEFDCFFTDTIVVNTIPLNFASIGNDTTICDESCIDLTATGGVDFLWNTGETTATINVCPEEESLYYVDVTNTIGCSSRDSITVSLYDLPVSEISDDQYICPQDTATLIVSGGSKYEWSNTLTNDTIKVSPTDTTTYYVWVYNENDCRVKDSVTVFVIPFPTADAGKDTSICLGDCIDLTASGGTSYEWDTGETTESIEVCPDDTTMYYVTVTNEFNCASIDSVEVIVKDVPITSTSNDTIVCPNECVKIWASGGDSYEWSTGATTDTIEVCPSISTKYYVTAKNSLGCETIDSVLVAVFSSGNASAGEDVYLCPGNCTELTASGGYAYTWSTGATTNKIEVCPDTDTEYTVEITDQYGCIAKDTVDVFLRTPPSLTVSDDTIKCVSDCVTLKASGALAYVWSVGKSGTSIEVCPNEETKYYVTGSDEFGCSTTDSVTVFISAYENVSLSGILPSYCDNASAVLLEGSPAGGTFGGEGVADNIFTPYLLSEGVYEVFYTITDDLGCAVGDTIDVHIYETPTISLGDDLTLCADETYEIFVTDGYDQYVWSNGNTSGRYLSVNVDEFGLGSTVVELIVTNNGCVARDEIIITFESCVGIDELEEIGISVYPNPNAGIFNIVYDGTQKDQYFSIYNLKGQMVYTKELNECNTPNCSLPLDVSSLDKGIYVIRFYSKQGIRSGKIILQ